MLERDAYKCAITGTPDAVASVTHPTVPPGGAPLEVAHIIPPSVDVRTLSRYAGLANDDPLCEPTPRFYRLENMLTLDDDASDEFRNLNVWLEETVRHLTTLTPPSSVSFLPLSSFFSILRLREA